jgi:MmyB-like transcription regulator ligand binding domain
VKFHRSGRKRLRHPAVGELDLNFESMPLSSDPGLQLTISTADPDSPTSDGLTLLSTWATTTRHESAVHHGPNRRGSRP